MDVSEEILTTICNLLNEGKNDAEIGRILNCHRVSIGRWKKKFIYFDEEAESFKFYKELLKEHKPTLTSPPNKESETPSEITLEYIENYIVQLTKLPKSPAIAKLMIDFLERKKKLMSNDLEITQEDVEKLRNDLFNDEPE